MKITFVASESNPFIKTGGLGDVVYSLAQEFVEEGHKVNIIIPFYSKIKDTIFTTVDYLGEFNVKVGWRNINTKVCKAIYRKINFYFIENDQYFARSSIYGQEDDGERFAYFTLASIETIKQHNLKSDIIHIHDWQVGMLPCVVRIHDDVYFNKTKFVLTIHNPAFQGNFETSFILDTYSLPFECYENGSIRMGDSVSTLKAGIMYSDKITTVSPNHREELLTVEGSYGLSGALWCRELDFVGVLNGIDYVEFNPENDRYISCNYDKTTFYEGKLKNKEVLLNRFNLPNDGLPLYGLVSRLTWQKGINLVVPMIKELAKKGAKFVILGSGEYELEQEFEDLRRNFPQSVGLYIGYNNELAHLIYAGCDFFLMPSLFEPCGLSQMISQRYGTLPIVRTTGGLKDSVIIYGINGEETANGFGFSESSVPEFIKTVYYSFDLYWNLPCRKKLILNALNTDNSWKKSAMFYLGIYKEIVQK